jgi:hypothetical protein
LGTFCTAVEKAPFYGRFRCIALIKRNSFPNAAALKPQFSDDWTTEIFGSAGGIPR